MPLIQDAEVVSLFSPQEPAAYEGEVPLYDYQEIAVNKMIVNHYGILQSPAGSGKTQMGIAIARKHGLKTLWLTHTKDLLTQSKKRAEQYLDPSSLGTITEGKVNIGQTMTFATIQTMCKVDLDQYRDEWDCIIVDECHRVSGTPTAVTQFSKVLNTLRARHKYGLSATVHRADGLIKATYAMLGEVVWTVPDEDVASKVMTVNVIPKGTGVPLDPCFLNSDGTVNYAKMITYLTEREDRNELIMSDLVKNQEHYNLVLSERVDHLKYLYSQLPPTLRKQAAVIDGKMTSKAQKAEREQAIEDMRTGEKRYLFATYSLAKEGLDIPRLDRLYLATPQKDYAVIVQSVGRVARTFEGKQQPLVYDYVDSIKSLLKSYKQRCASYRKCGCLITEE
jgi:superfamily II DNA or RNA helicase